MAKTTKTKSTKKTGEKATAKKSAIRKTDVAIEPADTAPETKATKKVTKEPKARDPRLPTPGTVLQKKSRGEVRCECTVLEDGGFLYKGTRFKSLSAAAKAAAEDLGGRTTHAVNGYLFFGLVKPTRRAGDPLAALDRAWQRYRDRVISLEGGGPTEDLRAQAAEVVEQHAGVLADLRGKLQTAGV